MRSGKGVTKIKTKNKNSNFTEIEINLLLSGVLLYQFLYVVNCVRGFSSFPCKLYHLDSPSFFKNNQSQLRQRLQYFHSVAVSAINFLRKNASVSHP